MIEPCACLKRILRAVSDGKAYCSRHKLFAEKDGGIVRAARVPFPSDLPPFTTRETPTSGDR
jgi:hypothetical protein